MADDKVNEVPTELSFVLPRWATSPLEGLGPLARRRGAHGPRAPAGRGHGDQLERRPVRGCALHARRRPADRGRGQPRAGHAGARGPRRDRRHRPGRLPARHARPRQGGPDRAGHVVRAVRDVHGRAAVGRREPRGLRRAATRTPARSASTRATSTPTGPIASGPGASRSCGTWAVRRRPEILRRLRSRRRRDLQRDVGLPAPQAKAERCTNSSAPVSGSVATRRRRRWRRRWPPSTGTARAARPSPGGPTCWSSWTVVCGPASRCSST